MDLKLLLSSFQLRANGDRIAELAQSAGRTFRPVIVEQQPRSQACEAEVAWLTRDLYTTSKVDDWSAECQQFFDCCQSCPALRVLHLFSSGTDFKVVDELLSRGVVVTSSIGASALPLAHTAIAGMLAISRGFPRFVEFKRNKVWQTPKAEDHPPDLGGQTVAIVGMGAVGAELARICKAFGMHVVAVTRRGDTVPTNCDECVASANLIDVAPRADWVMLACPLTAATRGMISAAMLARMPAGSSIINIARGALIDEAALCESLRTRHLRGAYLDVFETEPLPAHSALWDLPNIFISPHNAALSEGNAERSTQAFLANLNAHLRGLPLRNPAVR